jgi:hypothetical protein
MKNMLRNDTQSSTHNTQSSNDNVRFKSNYIKLVDHITNFSTDKLSRENLTSTFKKEEKNISANKLNKYKLDLFIKGDKSKVGSSYNKSNLKNLTSPRNKENVEINLENIKLNSELKYKYKNILENGLQSKLNEDRKIQYAECKLFF